MKARNVDRIRDKAEASAIRSLRILRRAMEAADKMPGQVEQDAQLRFADAPFYLHASLRLAAALAKPQEERTSTTTNLNVVITGQAPSTSAWLESVSKAANVIDAVPADSDKK